jgi:hypothetical protein
MMNRMPRIRITLAGTFLTLALPFAASAATITELQAQLQVLMAQLATLQAQQTTFAAPQSGAAISCPNLIRNLGRGMKGTDVTQFQNFLISQNLLASDNNTGFFGALTEIAVQQWQAKQGIVSSGTPNTTGYGAVGPRTRDRIAMSCKGQSGAVPDIKPPVPASVQQTQTPRIPTAPTTPTPLPTVTTIPSTPQPPLIGAIRWDAWFPGNTTVLPGYVPSSLYTTWSYREPVNGWYDAGNTAQSVMDAEINAAADHGLDFWAFNNYWAITNFSSLQSQWPLYDAFKKYMASPYKNRLKFTFVVNAGSLAYGDASQVTLGFWDTHRPYLIEMFKDSQYLKVEGNRPVIFVQNDVQNFLAQWSGGNYPGWPSVRDSLNAELKAAGLGNVFVVNTVMDLSGASAGVEGATSYGVMEHKARPDYSNCKQDSGSSLYHCPFSAQVAKDKNNWNVGAQSGAYIVPGLTPTNDPRPRSYGFYVDQPTYTEWQQQLKDVVAFMKSQSRKTNPPLALIYAWNELDEGGPGIMPTKQNGTMYLDALKAVKTGSYPSVYTDVYNGDNLSIAFSASAGSPNTWINYASLGGNFNNDEQISQSIGESASLSVSNAIGFEIKGTKGPNRGIMQVFIDNVSHGTVTLTDPNWYQNQTLFKSSVLPAGTHTLRIVNVSTDVMVAQVGIDQIIVTKQK